MFCMGERGEKKENALLILQQPVSEVVLKTFGSAWVSILFLVMSCEFSDSSHSGNPIKTKGQKNP